MSDYINKKVLRVEMEAYLATGKISDELTTMLDNLIRGVLGRYGGGVDRDDAHQTCWVLFLRHLSKIKPEMNTFGYLTSVVHNCVRAMRRGNHNDLEKLYRAFSEASSLGTIAKGDTRIDD